MFDFSKSGNQLPLLSQYVAEACCIHLGEEKRYLFESRLGTIIGESGARDIPDFIRLAKADTTGKLRDKIIDAMTTHETYWFRDAHPWNALEEELLPQLAAEVRSGKKPRIRILCAACSSGQEPYSIALLLHKLAAAGKLSGLDPSSFEIIGIDISPGTLFLASTGRYSQLEIARGLPDFWRDHYFDATTGNTWTLREPVRRLVSFKRKNLQDSLATMGVFDLVLCRNVAIYFKDDFKKDLFTRLSDIILPGGHMLLGGTESLFTHQNVFQLTRIKNAIFYKRL
jgi:chemotaxis protein methyltransferase CheR